MAAQRLADERRRHPGIGSPGISKGRKIGAH
jgi:hypothetical protein